ncbi:unnamed protein product [Sphagnum jensenii]|uniref:Uncharacterized protein n=1 Tax=Sphagnum jensenii TaxID=128206 RepID=A0ABP0VTW5_9BRYO
MMALMLMVLSLKGGFSNAMVTHQRFCSKVPDTLASDVAAPLLCAGITVYSPMMCHHMNQAGAGSTYFIMDTASGMYPLDPSIPITFEAGGQNHNCFCTSRDEVHTCAIVDGKHGSLLTHVIIGSAGLKTISGSMIGGMKEDLQEIIFVCQSFEASIIQAQIYKGKPIFTPLWHLPHRKFDTRAILLLLLEMLLKEQSQVDVLSPLRERGLWHSCETDVDFNCKSCIATICTCWTF